MSRAARSRSPQPNDSLKISRTIACFGRYVAKRPDGLRVDRDGCMRLDDIMHFWGDRAGLRETDILHAVRRHMFREHEHGGSLRFAIDGDRDGGIVIRVMPKEDEGRGDQRRRYPSPPQNGMLYPAVGIRPPERRIPKKIGSVLKAPMPTRPRPINGSGRPPALSDKLSMSLDDLISANEVIDLEADDDMNNQARHDRVMRSFRQMGLTPETMHLRKPPQEKNNGERANRGAGRPETRGRQRGGWSPAEKMHRYISWLTKAGFKEFGLEQKEGGWLELAGIAAMVTKNRKDLGEFDAEKLKLYIQDTDVDGRFEINASLLRKVDKADRQKRDSQRSPFEPARAGPGQAAREPLDTLEVSSSASSGRHRRRSRSLSLGSDSDRPMADDLEDAALAARCENLRVSGDVEIEIKPEVKLEPRFPRCTVQVPSPKPPPGEGWIRYKDEGDKGAYWWYYEGPEGQWWCGQEGADPLPYVG